MKTRISNAAIWIPIVVVVIPVLMYLLFWINYGAWWLIDQVVDFSTLHQAITTPTGVDLTYNQRWWLAFCSLFVFGAGRASAGK